MSDDEDGDGDGDGDEDDPDGSRPWSVVRRHQPLKKHCCRGRRFGSKGCLPLPARTGSTPPARRGKTPGLFADSASGARDGHCQSSRMELSGFMRMCRPSSVPAWVCLPQGAGRPGCRTAALR